MKHTCPHGSADRLEAFLLQQQQALSPPKASRATGSRSFCQHGPRRGGAAQWVPPTAGTLRACSRTWPQRLQHLPSCTACSSAGAWRGTTHALLLHGPCLEPASPSQHQPQPGPVPQSAKPVHPSQQSLAQPQARPSPPQPRPSFETRLKKLSVKTRSKRYWHPNP